MIEALILVVLLYAVISLATTLVTLLDYVDQTGALDWRALLYGLRDLMIVVFEVLWWVVILRAWGLLELPLETRALDLAQPQDQVAYVAIFSFAMMIALLYLDGRIGTSLFLALTSAIVLHEFLDVPLFTVFLIVSIVVLVSSAWIVRSQTKTVYV